MIQPKSKLPFKEVLSKNKRKYQIIDANDKIIIDSVEHLEDALFIENSCNNLQEAIKILNGVIHHNNGLKEEYKISPSLILEINNFLNKI